ncbi:PTS system IIB component, Glc family (TC 4.A.1)/PTS system IIC component, Glc family (TC 4.A.1) [Gracilibacillus ureilyticus]|uniref:PTS system IIB component, Glc family (TC 4.A.1)/PTS system IIC component, Glc family (TC 4.A.1) n=1 Tax=Gracilibacillus ureilyticus TaxID=531814 RepID=A0A1H9T953_9BACI|nr:PTS transporter subunit EIIC [Gracilibacillus ureilyticus]SER93691.1 PTS system IIB component, Glc family (TC 4.A.1)/PTS system IIC component, Glc family (TC 4.A.1) [Gracilibacillus ureilyticus]
MEKKKKYHKLAEDVLNAVGGKDNVTNVTHCMTRLRFNLKDESIPNKEELEKISGVLGVTKAGGQFQVIIGQTVDKVFANLSDIGGFDHNSKTDDDQNQPKRKTTLKSIGSNILDGLAGCLTPLIPLLIGAAMFKLLVSLLGPTMLNLIEETSDLYILLNFVGDAGFYFLPIIVGYTAAKKFGATPVVAMFLGGIMLHPTLMGIAAEGSQFSVYGIPTNAVNYSSTILPMIMSVWVMSYIERFFKQYLPSTLKTVLAPSLTILVILPIALTVLGPLGSFLGIYIADVLLSFNGVAGFIGIAIVAALWQFLVMSGMHIVMISTVILVFSSGGNESFIMPAAGVASLAVSGMCLGVALRIKHKEQRGLSIGYLIAGFVGGVTEPGLYGVGIRYKRPLIGMMIGAFAGGLYAGITQVTAYTMVPVASILAVLSFAGGPIPNFVQGVISCAIAFIVATIATYFTGFKRNDPITKKQA